MPVERPPRLMPLALIPVATAMNIMIMDGLAWQVCLAFSV
jgi:hypothetical protein